MEIATLRKNGNYAFTVMEVSDIDDLPYYYLVALAEATNFATPHLAFKSYPELFAPMSLV